MDSKWCAEREGKIGEERMTDVGGKLQLRQRSRLGGSEGEENTVNETKGSNRRSTSRRSL